MYTAYFIIIMFVMKHVYLVDQLKFKLKMYLGSFFDTFEIGAQIIY